MSAREEILAAIRAAGCTAVPAPERHYQQQDLLSPAQSRARFIERVIDYGVKVTEIQGENSIAMAVADVCAARGITILVASPHCPWVWRPDGITLIEDHGLPIEQLATIPAALTGAACAIAETGTLVLDGTAAQGRRAISLLADFHICVLYADQIVECVPVAIAALHEAALRHRPITLISGPSATADIEFDRVQGVHGPRQLDLILVENRA